LLPLMGYQDTCAYRPLRVLADALADAGHVVLRVDWPALGDSALDETAPGLVARCVQTVAAASSFLRARGFERVAGLGVRAGALLALAAEGLDEVVLWATPPSGKAYLREERAFQKMAAAGYGRAPADAPPMPEGSVEAGGFLYGADTVAALERLDAALLAASSRLQRALVLGRDGATPAKALVQALSGSGVQVMAADGSGLGDLLDDPYRAKLDPGVRNAMLRWFSATPGRVAFLPHKGADRLDLGVAVERPWALKGEVGELSGVVCEPVGGVVPGVGWTIFFNAGGVRRSGPNRLWTRSARALASRGVPSLRFDVRDVGDSDGTSVPHGDLEAMYAESSIADAVRAYDWVKAQGAGAVDVVGLCSGAFHCVQVASRRRVRRALLFNALAFVWNEEARASGMTAHLRSSLFSAQRWGRLLSGKIDARALASAILSKSWLMIAGRLSRLRGAPPPDPVEALFRSIAHAGTEIRIVCSEGDTSISYLEGHVSEPHRPPVTLIPGADHTIRPVWAHSRVVALIVGDE